MKRLLALLLIFFATPALASTIVNDGNINWNGNWQQTYSVKTLHASTNLNVDNGTSQVSAAWDGDGARDDLGCLVYLNSVTTPATARTITLALEEDDNDDGNWADAVTRASTTFTINSDTNTATWYYFKYGAAFANEEAGTANYRIKLTSDNAADTGFRADSASATNIAIIQVLNATEACDASDVTYIVGTVQASTGDPTAQTVTVNVSADGTAYGEIVANNAGTLAYRTNAATTTYLEIAGNITLYNGSEFDIGTAGVPIPIDSAATLEFNTTAADRYIDQKDGSKIQWVGIGFTGNVWRTTTTEAIDPVGEREVNVTAALSAAGWAANHDIIISTTSGVGETEEKIISAVADGAPNTLTITTDWTNTHLGGAEICNISRPVRFTCSGSNDAYLSINNTTNGNLIFQWVRVHDINNPSVNVFTMPASGTPQLGDGYFQYVVFDSSPRALTYSGSQPLPGNQSFTGICAWFNGATPTGTPFSFTAYTLSSGAAAFKKFTITDSVFAKLANYGGLMVSVTWWLDMTDCNFYDYTAGSAVNRALNFYTGDLTNVKIWGLEEGITGRGSTNNDMSFLPIAWRAHNCCFGTDGTNTIANSVADIVLAHRPSTVNLYNSTITTVLMPTTWTVGGNRTFVASHNHGATASRYKVFQPYGILSDNTTTAMNAQDHPGTCLVFTPSSSTGGQEVVWEFSIPVQAATDPQCKFYNYTDEATPEGVMEITVYDSDDDSTVLNNAGVADEVVTLANAWTQRTVTLTANPTITGWCRVVIKCRNTDATVCHIGVDTLTYVNGGSTYTYNFNEWKDALPSVTATTPGGGGGGTGSISVSTNF